MGKGLVAPLVVIGAELPTVSVILVMLLDFLIMFMNWHRFSGHAGLPANRFGSAG